MKSLAPETRLSLLAALSRANASPAATLGAITFLGVFVFIGEQVIPFKLGSSHDVHRDLVEPFAVGVTVLVSLVCALVSPGMVSTQIVRDRASGAFDLAREADRSPTRRLAAYVFGPGWPTLALTAVVFLATMSSMGGGRLGVGAWLGIGLAVMGFQVLSSVLAATLALALPRARMGPQTQGIGFVIPLGLAMLAGGLMVATSVHAWPLLALITAASAAPFAWVARSLIERPERPVHVPHGALSLFFFGTTTTALMACVPSGHGPSTTALALWGIVVASVTASWTLPRTMLVAHAIRRGAGDLATRALVTALGVSAVIGAIVLLSTGASRSAIECAMLTAALSVTATSMELRSKTAPTAQRQSTQIRHFLVSLLVVLLEVVAIASEPVAWARFDPFASLWSRGDLADGHATRLLLLAALAGSMAWSARASWQRAVRRLALSDATV
jgi:hypothetical protein